MMTWDPINFQKISQLDKSIYHQLDQFLYEKEGLLGQCIIHSIHPEAHLHFHLKLSEALENFERRLIQLSLNPKQQLSENDFHKTESLINGCLWQYVETLEGCVIELFQQIDQLGLEKWSIELESVVESIKITLSHRIEDVSWAIRRLESLLWKYREICTRKKRWTSLINWLPWSALLDRGLLKNLEKSKKFLCFRFKKFSDRLQDFNKVYEESEQSADKFQNFHMFNTLDSNDQQIYKSIYTWVKLWEINQTTQSLPSQLIAKALRQTQNEDKVYQVFNDYFQALKEILYRQARLFKLGPEDLWKDSTGKFLVLDVLSGHRTELHTLGATVLKYRDFLLKTDADPYVRSRWGFAEWIVGPEPSQTKRFLNLSYEIEGLDALFEKLHRSLDKDRSSKEGNHLMNTSQQIDRWLHECAQPLASRAIMHTNIEHIVFALENLDELGSFDRNAIDFVGQTLSKILRVDWKYNVAFEIPKFKQIYHIHKGLEGESEDRQHFNRLNKFRYVIRQIEEWAQEKKTQIHFQDIENDMSDMKDHLQDFLVFVQRMIAAGGQDKMEGIRKEIRRQLLEYRYVFGQFFHHLSQFMPEDRVFRNQFLFVYQYFETIENRLNENV